MRTSQTDMALIIEKRCNVRRVDAERLTARLANIEDGELAQAADRWALTGREDDRLERGGLSASDLRHRGFIYPNVLCCLNDPHNASALLAWL